MYTLPDLNKRAEQIRAMLNDESLQLTEQKRGELLEELDDIAVSIQEFRDYNF